MKTFLTRTPIVKIATSHWRTYIFCCLITIVTGCESEEVSVTNPKNGPVTIQMFNFNVPLDGGILDNTAPDIYYFKQKEDGSYIFMLTSTNYGNFETNWQTDYIFVQTDKNGVIQKTEVKKSPSKDGITGNFEYVWDVPPVTPYPGSRMQSYSLPINRTTSGPSYIADQYGLLYYQLPNLAFRQSCYCKAQFFNLNPETGESAFISVGTSPALTRSFRTTDGGFISVGWEGSPDFAKYSSSGNLQFKQSMPYWEERPSYAYLTDSNGDFYFIVAYNSGFSFNAYPSFSPMIPLIDGIARFYSENKANSFFRTRYSRLFWENFGNEIPSKVEIRFGPGKKQMAHRYSIYNNYLDYVEVPFEVWYDDKQVMVSFRDQGGEGKFNLVPFNYNEQTSFDDPTQSLEEIWINGNNYAETPDPSIMNRPFLFMPGFGVPNFVWPYLAEGATWNPNELPDASFSWASTYSRPGPQLIKVNADGASVVKENFELGGSGVLFKTLYKAVPVQDGFAVLINAPQVTVDPSDPHLGNFGYQPTQLAILDANFNQTNVISTESTPDDYSHQLESNNVQVFYARITARPNSTGGKNSLLLTTISNNNLIEKYLDYNTEAYRITPTRDGGVALVAWVRPTDNTRDLVFIEFDENLDLVRAPK